MAFEVAGKNSSIVFLLLGVIAFFVTIGGFIMLFEMDGLEDVAVVLLNMTFVGIPAVILVAAVLNMLDKKMEILSIVGVVLSAVTVIIIMVFFIIGKGMVFGM